MIQVPITTKRKTELFGLVVSSKNVSNGRVTEEDMNWQQTFCNVPWKMTRYQTKRRDWGVLENRIFRSSVMIFYLGAMWHREWRMELYLFRQKLVQFKVGSFVRLCPVLSAFDFCFILCHIFVNKESQIRTFWRVQSEFVSWEEGWRVFTEQEEVYSNYPTLSLCQGHVDYRATWTRARPLHTRTHAHKHARAHTHTHTHTHRCTLQCRTKET